jgi:hypothetical protein
MPGHAKRCGGLGPTVPLARALLLAGALLGPLTILPGKSATYDEVAHLPAGYSYLTTGVFKLNPLHPPLIKELCAIPLLFLRPALPIDGETLRRAEIPLAYQWSFGWQFFNRQDADRLLFWGRVPAVLLSAGVAILVMRWATDLWGPAGGLLALALYVFEPTVTAHAQLVTTDVGFAFFATLFLYLWRRYLTAPSGRRLLAAGAGLGLALGAKFSGVALVPIAAALGGLAAWSVDPGPPGAPGRPPRLRSTRPRASSALGPRRGDHRAWRLLGVAGAVAFLLVPATLVLWAIYFFPADPLFYWHGLQTVNADHDPSYPRYLMGELKPGGWPYYLLVAWLVKTPLPFLLLLGGASIVFVLGRRASRLDEAFLLVPAITIFLGYSVGAYNLGVRYLIPCLPFLMIFAGRIVPALATAPAALRRVGIAALAALVLWYVAEFAVIWPDHLAYFNEAAGGPDNGPAWLDGSNVDWGQGLIQLQHYLASQPIGEYRFCYSGSGHPGHYGITGEPVTFQQLAAGPPTGTLIASAHCVARTRGLLARAHGQGPGNWMAHARPRTVVGHAYYIYDLSSLARSP